MLIDLTCPAEVFRTAMPSEEIPAASLLMFNLSDRVIVSAEITLRLLGAGGAEKEKVVFRGRALNGRPHSTFSMNIPCAPVDGATQAEATVEKVWFSDNDSWRRAEHEPVEYQPNALPISKGLTSLKYVAGENAVGWPSQQKGLWVCVCGRPNPDSLDVCARCRQDKTKVFASYTKEAVDAQVHQREKQLELSSRSAREDTARLQRIREEDYNRRKKHRARRARLIAGLVLFLVFITAAVGIGIPALRLWSAREIMATGDYAAAREALEGLGAFPGVAGDIAECDWQTAAANARDSQSPAVLEEASKVLREMAEREGSAALADDADLRRGRILLEEKGDYIGALKAISLIDPENPGAAELTRDCVFAEASDYLDTGYYVLARESFLSLGDYPRAAELASECVYIPAAELVQNGQYDEAITQLSRIPDYKDSRQLTLLCHYRKAQAAEDADDLETAAAEYLMAGDYEDASDKTRQIVYILADRAAEAGDMEEAQRLYASIPGFLDADDKNYAILYSWARVAFADNEYIRTVEILSPVPVGENVDIEDMRVQAAYQAGKNALNREDWDQAVEMFRTAGDYKDAAKLREQAEISRTRVLYEDDDDDE